MFCHVGMDRVLPNHRTNIPQIGRWVTVVVGEPLDFRAEVEEMRRRSEDPAGAHRHVTDCIQEELGHLRECAEELHAKLMAERGEMWRPAVHGIKEETECKDKWRHLRSNFMRERRKISAKTSGSGNTETRKWVYYDAMQFLIPHVTPRPTSSNVPTPPDEDTCHEAEDAPQDSSPSVVIETPDNVSPQEAASNTETCEDRSTAKPILPMSKKTSVTKKRSRDTADEIDEEVVVVVVVEEEEEEEEEEEVKEEEEVVGEVEEEKEKEKEEEVVEEELEHHKASDTAGQGEQGKLG
ncbi:hypothetical protein O3P69_013541 [Scylla paramamosain]|uniref:MADF domain-containing protein n=1 Tax=Scylla paramamosain TaxID=85552 RepID=A0AAW0S9S8_SCYPA